MRRLRNSTKHAQRPIRRGLHQRHLGVDHRPILELCLGRIHQEACLKMSLSISAICMQWHSTEWRAGILHATFKQKISNSIPLHVMLGVCLFLKICQYLAVCARKELTTLCPLCAFAPSSYCVCYASTVGRTHNPANFMVRFACSASSGCGRWCSLAGSAFGILP